MELYKKHRPRKLEDVMGQEGAVSALRTQIESNRIPHALLLSGPSGTGKTTIARILKRVLNCGDADFQEINAADFKGIDTVRDIRRLANLSPIDGECRIYLIDECHKMTNDAQNSLLKLLEDNPRHVYFMLATTDPGKLLRTIITRCNEIRLQGMSEKALEKTVRRVMEKEQIKLSDTVVDEIVEVSEGSARKALVILESVMGLKTEKEQMEAIASTTLNKDNAISLARALIKPNGNWKDVSPILVACAKDDAESIRYCVLGYCRAVLLGGGFLASRAYTIIDIFSRNFYDSKHAGLAAACWEVIHYSK